MPLHGTHGSATHACIIKKAASAMARIDGQRRPCRQNAEVPQQIKQADSAGKNTSSAQGATHYRKVTTGKLKDDKRGCLMIEEGCKRKERTSCRPPPMT